MTMGLKKKATVPQRTSEGGLAVIRHPSPEGTLWLTQWNEGWNAYNLVGGHREDETFRECVEREVMEELELIPQEHFTVAPRPLAHLRYSAFSHSAQVSTAYTMVLFEVTLNSVATGIIQHKPENVWLTESEIHNQQTKTGRPVSETVGLLLGKAGLLSTGAAR